MVKPDTSSVWSVVHDERGALIRDLDALGHTQWRTPSTCPGWDVHDVLAHLVDTAKTTRLRFLRSMVSAGFDFDRANAEGVTREKAADPSETLSAFRAVRTKTATPPAALATRLVEAFVHGEDIRRPLGLSREYPAAHVAQALAYQVETTVKIGGGKESAQGWRLVATDTPFAHGVGPEVHGTAIALLLAVSGRPVEAFELTGPGTPDFTTSTQRKS